MEAHVADSGGTRQVEITQPQGRVEAVPDAGITEAELVVAAAALFHRGTVGRVQGPVPDQADRIRRQCKQGVKLRFGERASSRHGRVSQLGV